jgi:hypothetical protein
MNNAQTITVRATSYPDGSKALFSDSNDQTVEVMLAPQLTTSELRWLGQYARLPMGTSND